MTLLRSEVRVFDDRPCELGEGPLWHPERGQLFWFDIVANRLLTRDADGPRAWDFDGRVSAAGWIDRDRLLIAGERALFTFDLASGAQEAVAPLDADDRSTRSNDGRADPWGGFWIGTMGKKAEPGAGAVHRWHRGELRRLFAPMTIPNAMCFSPDRRFAHFADTPTRKVWRVALDAADGWPAGEPEVLLDFEKQGLHPDGAVTDAAGNLWIAFWGGGAVRVFSPGGEEIDAVPLPAGQTTCPAFGGPDLSTLHVTSAWEHLSAEARADQPRAGMTFVVETQATGLPSPRVVL